MDRVYTHDLEKLKDEDGIARLATFEVHARSSMSELGFGNDDIKLIHGNEGPEKKEE